ncbi:MAG: cyclase family protein [Proteobacteria bacterium]|nr:cyclase family protein [Pseudomonadota bacterium]
MTRWIDVSVPLERHTPTWPGSRGFRLDRIQEIGPTTAAVSVLTADVHCGTHVDAPRHFLADGGTVDQIPLERFIGPAFVAHLEVRDLLTADALEAAGIPPAAHRLLLRTDNSALWSPPGATFRVDFAALDAPAAEWVVARGIELLGVDYLSVEAFGGGGEVHRKLLRADVTLVEGLNLSRIQQGWHDLICLPLLLVGAEGSPARVLLRQNRLAGDSC